MKVEKVSFGTSPGLEYPKKGYSVDTPVGTKEIKFELVFDDDYWFIEVTQWGCITRSYLIWQYGLPNIFCSINKNGIMSFFSLGDAHASKFPLYLEKFINTVFKILKEARQK
jgi:hypothetical protein